MLGEIYEGFFRKIEEAYPEILQRLVLLGTVHHDPNGYRRLIDFLSLQSPDVVLVEISPYALAFRRRHYQSLHRTLHRNLNIAALQVQLEYRTVLKHPEVAAIRKLLRTPFEYMAASAYVQNRGGNLFLIDKSSLSWRLTQSWRRLISVENLAILITSPTPRLSIHQIYRKAERIIDMAPDQMTSNLFTDLDESEKLWLSREHFMARQIERILKFFRPEKPVYIGGWWHLTPPGRLPTIRSILDIDASQCRLLDASL